MTILRLIMLALVTGRVGGETRIIKGYECSPHSQPWQVALFQKTRLLCGATLIAPKWLLTAAHCRKPRYIAHLGEHNLQQRDGCEQTRIATESFPHPDFNNSLPNKDHRNDIMLVKMASPAIITWAVRPLALSSRCVTPGTRCLISGWGTTSSPQCRVSRGEHGGRRVVTIVEDHREPEDLPKMRVVVTNRGLPRGGSGGISRKEEWKSKRWGRWRQSLGLAVRQTWCAIPDPQPGSRRTLHTWLPFSKPGFSSL
ncbi:kallikrein-11 isoform X1 [Diceros bicornis minor]|uniref:kallikrein-11 isoform X1 n=1 Tax=Diceros bicornis minor TaxID=77932 RepID=UPI0026EC372C|nr:kallikrein-11 isoform X1 [Diceros bicornis minor]